MSENLCIICQSHDNCFYESTFKLWCPRFKKKPPTNADRIRAMTDEELAETLYMGCGDRNEYTCKISKTYDELNLSYMSEEEEDAICIQCWLDWLKQGVDE